MTGAGVARATKGKDKRMNERIVALSLARIKRVWVQNAARWHDGSVRATESYMNGIAGFDIVRGLEGLGPYDFFWQFFRGQEELNGKDDRKAPRHKGVVMRRQVRVLLVAKYTGTSRIS